MTTKLSRHLILDGASLRDKTVAMFDELSSTPALAKLFSDNPTAVMHERLFPSDFPRLDESQIGAANMLLMNILNNKKFSAWLADYQTTLESEVEATKKQPDKAKLREDFAAAITKFGDPRLVGSLLSAKDKKFVGSDPRVADTVVEIESVIYAVDVAAVLIAVVAVAVIGRVQDPVTLRASSLSSAELVNIAKQLRANAKRSQE